MGGLTRRLVSYVPPSDKRNPLWPLDPPGVAGSTNGLDYLRVPLSLRV